MPLISGFLRRLVGVNNQGQAETQLGGEGAALCGVFGANLGPRSLRSAVERARTAFRLEIALQHFPSGGIVPQNRHLLCPGEEGCEHCWRDSGRQRFPFACQPASH